jgi:hypothetical protein
MNKKIYIIHNNKRMSASTKAIANARNKRAGDPNQQMQPQRVMTAGGPRTRNVMAQHAITAPQQPSMNGRPSYSPMQQPTQQSMQQPQYRQPLVSRQPNVSISQLPNTQSNVNNPYARNVPPQQYQNPPQYHHQNKNETRTLNERGTLNKSNVERNEMNGVGVVGVPLWVGKGGMSMNEAIGKITLRLGRVEKSLKSLEESKKEESQVNSPPDEIYESLLDRLIKLENLIKEKIIPL